MAKRKNINTTLDEDLYQEVRILALKLKVNANDLIEEGMRYIIRKNEMTNEEVVRQAISSLKISGFTLDQESEQMWDKFANGELTTEDVRLLTNRKLDQLRLEHPEYFTEPDK